MNAPVFARTAYCLWLVGSIVLLARDHVAYIQSKRHRGKKEVSRYAAFILGRVPIPSLSPILSVFAGGFLVACLLASLPLPFEGTDAYPELLTSPRTFLLLAVAFYFLFFAQVLDQDYVQEKVSLTPLVLLLFALSPDAASRSTAQLCTPTGTSFLMDSLPREEGSSVCLVCIRLVLCHSYFASGLVKLRRSGLHWARGETMQGFLLMQHLHSGGRVALELGRRFWLCSASSVAALGFELVLSCPLLTLLISLGANAHVRGIFHTAYALTGVSFHAGVMVALNTNFLSYFVPVYVVFLPDILSQETRNAILCPKTYDRMSSSPQTPEIDGSWIPLLLSSGIVAFVYGSTLLYHVKYFEVTYWDVKAYWPLFGWDLYSIPPPSNCYSTSTVKADQSASTLDCSVRSTTVTACRIEVTIRKNPTRGFGALSEETRVEWLSPLWAYDLRSVAFSHLVLRVAPVDLGKVALFFGLITKEEKSRLGSTVNRMDLLDHVIGTALKLGRPDQLKNVVAAKLVMRTMKVHGVEMDIIDKVLRRCSQNIVDEACQSFKI